MICCDALDLWDRLVLIFEYLVRKFGASTLAIFRKNVFRPIKILKLVFGMKVDGVFLAWHQLLQGIFCKRDLDLDPDF